MSLCQHMIKKAIILITVAALGKSSLAQEQVSNNFKFDKSDKSLEVRFAPFSENPIRSSSLNFRYFISDKSALRVVLSVNGSNSSTIIQDKNDDFQHLELQSKNSNFSGYIAPGYEIHLEGTEKLSPYYGAQLSFGYSRYEETLEEQPNGGVYWQPLPYKITTVTTSSSFRGGAYLLAGADYYFSKNIYLGAELNVGARGSFPQKTKIKRSAPDIDIEDPDPTLVGTTTSVNWGPSALSTFRLGIVF